MTLMHQKKVDVIINTTYSGCFIMYKDIFESIRNEAEKRNLRERTILNSQHIHNLT